MAVFDDVVIEWDGKKYTVPADDIMRLIAKVEDVITLHELFTYAEKGTAPTAKLAMAYATALRHVGVKVRDDEVYKKIFGAADSATSAQAVINALLMMMVPPSDLEVEPAKPGAAKPRKKPAAKSSSKRPTKRQ